MTNGTDGRAELVLRIFISSPGDVSEERVVAQRVVERIAARVAPRVKLAPILWEHEPLRASSTPQADVPDPAVCDMVVCILWSRLGTRLPANVTRPDGTHYNSGTEFEFESAVNAFEDVGRPHLLVYRKTAEATVSLSDSQRARQSLMQRENLDQFFKKWFSNEDGSLPRAFHIFQSIDEFEDRLEAHLTKLVMQEIERLGVEVGDSAIWRGNPFRGLSVFEAEHAPVFFGRRRQVADILDLMRRRDASGADAVCIIGPSGSGKSSCARAGVLPMLVEPGVMPRATSWRTAIMTPGPRPLSALRAALALALGTTVDAAPSTELAKWAEDKLAEGATAPEEPHLVVLVDQLEEVFSPTARASEERDTFIAEVVALAASRKVWVIFTMRGDFTDALQRDPVLVELLGDQGLYHLGFPDIREFSELIRRPTLSAGLRFETDPVSGLGLDDIILKDAMAAQDALPLVQFCLFELFTRRDESKRELTFEAYQRLGGITGAIGERAEACFSAQPADVQGAFDDVFRGLAEMDDDVNARPAKKQADKSSLTVTAPAASLVEALLGARLLIAEDAPHGGATVRVAHESLFLAWPRLADWIAENRLALAVRRRVEQGARLWLAADEDAQLLLAEGRPLREAEDAASRNKGLFAADAQRFLAASRARARARLRRRRVAVGALAGLGVIVAAGSVAWGLRETAQSRRLADSTQKIEQSQALADERLRDLFTNEALRRNALGDVQAAGVLLDAAGATRSGERPFAEQFLLADVRARIGVVTGRLLPQADAVQTASWIGGVGSQFATGDVQGVVRLWYPADGQLLASWEAHDAPVSAIASTPDGALVATSGMDGLTRVRRVAEPETDLAVHYGHTGSVLGLAMAVAPDGAVLMATAGADNNFVSWKVGVEAPLSRIRLPGRPASPVYAASRGEAFAVGYRGGLTTLAPDGAMNQLDWPGETVVEIVAEPEFGWLAGLSASGRGRLWRRASDTAGYAVVWDEADVSRLQPDVANQALIVIRHDGSSTLRPVEGEAVATIASAGDRRILDGVVSRDHACMLDLGADGRVASVHLPERGRWSTLSTPARAETRFLPAPGKDLVALTGPTGETQFLSLAGCGGANLMATPGDRTLAVSAKARLAAFGREDGGLDIVSLDTGKLERTLVHSTTGWVNAASFSLDGEYVATIGGDFAVWSARTGVLVHRAAPATGRHYQLGGFTADGLVLLQSRPLAQSRSNIMEQTELRQAPRFDQPIAERSRSINYALEFAPVSGVSVAAVRSSESIATYWYDEMREIETLSSGTPTAMAVSPVGGRIAGGDATGAVFVSLWAYSQSDPEAAWPATGSPVRHLQFSDAGDWLAASHADGRLRIFKPDEGSVVDARLPADTAGPMAFFADGAGLIVGGSDGVVRVVSSETGAILASLADLGGPILNLTFDASSRTLVVHSRTQRMIVVVPYDPAQAGPSGEAAGLIARNAPLRGDILEDDVVRLALEKLPGVNLTGEIGGGVAPFVDKDDQALALAASDRLSEAGLILAREPHPAPGSAKSVLAGLLAARDENTSATIKTNDGRTETVAASDKWVVATGWDGDIVALSATTLAERGRRSFPGLIGVVDVLPQAPVAVYFRSNEDSDYVPGIWNFETDTVQEFPEFNNAQTARDGGRIRLRQPTDTDGRRVDVRRLDAKGVVGESIWTYEGPPAARFWESDNLEHLVVIEPDTDVFEIHPIGAGKPVRLSDEVVDAFGLSDDPITDVAISDATQTLLAQTNRGRILRIDMATGETHDLLDNGSGLTACFGGTGGDFLVTTGDAAVSATAAGEIGRTFRLENGYVEGCEAGVAAVVTRSSLLFVDIASGKTVRRSASTSGDRVAFAGPKHVVHADRSGVVRRLDVAADSRLATGWRPDWSIDAVKLCDNGRIGLVSGRSEVMAVDLVSQAVLFEETGLDRLLATACLPRGKVAIATPDGVRTLIRKVEDDKSIAKPVAAVGSAIPADDPVVANGAPGEVATEDTASENLALKEDSVVEEAVEVAADPLLASAGFYEDDGKLLLVAMTDADTLLCQSVGADAPAAADNAGSVDATPPEPEVGDVGMVAGAPTDAAPVTEKESPHATVAEAALGDNLCSGLVVPVEAHNGRSIDFQPAKGDRPARILLAARNRIFAVDLGTKPAIFELGGGRGASIASRYVGWTGVRALSYEAGGRAILSRAMDGSGKLEEWAGHTDAITAAAILDDDRLATGDAGHGLLVWNVGSGEAVRLEAMRGAAASAIAQLTPSVLVFGGRDGSLEFQDLAKRRAFIRLLAHTEPVLGIVPLPDGTGFVSYSVSQILLHRLDGRQARDFPVPYIAIGGIASFLLIAGASLLWWRRTTRRSQQETAPSKTATGMVTAETSAEKSA